MADDVLITAARTLMRAGQWEIGESLLASAGNDPWILLVRAELAVDRDFWCGTTRAGDAVAKAGQAATSTSDPAYAWQVELLGTQHAYYSTIIGLDGNVRIGPGRHTPEVASELARRAERVHTTAPRDARGGWAAFWRGVIADNVAGDPATALPFYAEALRSGEEYDDDELAAEALRHQGGHARRLGDHEQARRLWKRSIQLRQRAGLVPGALSQQLALAANAADTGEVERAGVIATEVRGWAEALGLSRLAAQARRLLPGGES